MPKEAWKYTDRAPLICPAGIPRKEDTSVAECMVYYSLQDKMDALKFTSGVRKKPFTFKLPPLKTNRNCGIYTQIAPLMGRTPDTAYQVLTRELGETALDTYWKKPIGKERDPCASLPPGMNNTSHTFGVKNTYGPTLYSVILPNKSQCEVVHESHVGHDLYRKSHKSFYPSEQMDRNYLKPAYKPNFIYGAKPCMDYRGIGAKRCLQWVGLDYVFQDMSIDSTYGQPNEAEACCTKIDFAKLAEGRRNMRMDEGLQPVQHVNHILGERLTRYEPQVGQSLRPNKIECQLPQCFTFGKATTPGDSVSELMRDCPPSVEKMQLERSVGHINSVRQMLKNRRDPVPYDDMRAIMKYNNPSQDGWIPFVTASDICAEYRIFFNPEYVLDFLIRSGDMLQICPEAEDQMEADLKKAREAKGLPELPNIKCKYKLEKIMVNYENFMNIIDWRSNFPDLDKINDLPKEFQHYVTTYMDANQNYKDDVHKDMEPSGLPTLRTNVVYPKIPDGQCLVIAESLGPETGAAAVISPSIMTAYGVNHRDLLLPRPKEIVRGIFERTGVEFPDNTFDVIYEEAVRLDCFDGSDKGLCCLETFRNQMHKLAYEYYLATL